MWDIICWLAPVLCTVLDWVMNVSFLLSITAYLSFCNKIACNMYTVSYWHVAGSLFIVLISTFVHAASHTSLEIFSNNFTQSWLKQQPSLFYRLTFIYYQLWYKIFVSSKTQTRSLGQPCRIWKPFFRLVTAVATLCLKEIQRATLAQESLEGLSPSSSRGMVLWPVPLYFCPWQWPVATLITKRFCMSLQKACKNSILV